MKIFKMCTSLLLIFSFFMTYCLPAFAISDSDLCETETVSSTINDLWTEILPGAEIEICGDTVQAHKITPINSAQTRSGNTTQLIRSDTIGVISLSDSLPKDELFNTMVAAAQRGNYASAPDPSLAATVWTQIYYNVTTYAGSNVEYYSCSKITGGFSGPGTGAGLSSGVVCVRQKISFGQTGMTRSDGNVSYTGEDQFSGSQRNWTSSYNFSSWKPIAKYPTMTALGCTLTTTFQRGSGSWKAELKNYVLGG